MSADIERLLLDLYANPDSTEARAVLADAWLERGDPRGEFVALQLLPERTPAQDERVHALLRDHQREWLGPALSAVLVQPVFQSGFLDEAELAPHYEAAPGVWEAATRDPRLATVRVLHQGQGHRDHYRAFVLSPAMRDLRRVRVEVEGAALLDALAEGPPRAIEGIAFERAPKRMQLARIASAPALARVNTIALVAGALDDFFADAQAVRFHDRLARLELLPKPNGRSAPLRHFRDIVSRFPNVEQVVLHARGLGLLPNGAHFTRGPDGWSLALRDDWWYGSNDWRSDVPTGLVRVTVSVHGRAQPGLREEFQREWGCPVEIDWR